MRPMHNIEVRRRRQPASFASTALLSAFCALFASCTVDYAGILGGKACDQSGACAAEFVCDKATWTCVKADGAPPGQTTGDGGGKDGSGPVVIYDTGVVDAGGGHDAGTAPDADGTDAATDDTGFPEDAGADDAGGEDAGDLDAGALACLPGKHKCVSETELEVCKADGSGWEPKETCAAYCLTNKCVNCKPGTKWCGATGDVEACGADGMKIDITDCQFGCDAATTACMVCQPALGWCDGNVAETCTSDGMNITQTDCCIPDTCKDGVCTVTTPFISDAAPLSGDEGSEVTITINGCNFRGDSQVHWFIGWWDEAPNGSYTSRAPTQILYRLKPVIGPKGTNYKFRVNNPGGGGNSNEMTFHVNN